ncbi:flippase [Haladaptatus caseinilyticus]|uniref:flippase n=1 Tax=Haladaptatus caseinilyticus TaxID=2993314 RepID=UPI00224ABD99|nr:flippase [Haladaptatus caseinilyticus]
MNGSFTEKISITFIGGIVGRFTQYFIYILISRSLGPAALGVFSFGYVLLSFVSIISRLGLDNAAKKFIPKYSDTETKIRGIILLCLVVPAISGSILSVGVFLLYDVLNGVVQFKVARNALLFLVGVPAFSSLTVAMAATLGFRETKYSVYAKDIIQSGSAGILIAAVVYFHGSIRLVIAAYVVSIVLGLVYSIAVLARKSGMYDSLRYEIRYREVLLFSIPVMFTAVSQYLVSWTDILMLGILMDSAAVGYYQVAFQTAAIMGFIMFGVNSLFPSVAADLYHSDRLDELRTTYQIITKWITYLTVVSFLFIVIKSDEILRLFGSSFEQSQMALIVLGTAFIVAGVVGPTGYLLSMTGYERVEMVNNVVIAVLNIVLNYVLIGKFGVLGAAFSTSISLSLLNVLRVVETWVFLDIAPDPSSYYKGIVPIAASMGTLAATSGLVSGNLIDLVVSGLAYGLTFVVLMYYFGFEKRDRKLLQPIQ